MLGSLKSACRPLISICSPLVTTRIASRTPSRFYRTNTYPPPSSPAPRMPAPTQESPWRTCVRIVAAERGPKPLPRRCYPSPSPAAAADQPWRQQRALRALLRTSPLSLRAARPERKGGRVSHLHAVRKSQPASARLPVLPAAPVAAALRRPCSPARRSRQG